MNERQNLVLKKIVYLYVIALCFSLSFGAQDYIYGPYKIILETVLICSLCFETLCEVGELAVL